MSVHLPFPASLSIVRNFHFHYRRKSVRRIVYFICFTLIMSVSLIGQDKPEAPIVEVFGGYSRLIGDQQGFNVSIAGNVNRWFGVVGDFSHLSAKMTEGDFSEEISGNIYLVGPQVSYRGNKRFIPFARALIGAATVKSKLSSGTESIEFSETNFSYGAGGGLDIRVNKHVAIRAIQLDYIHTSAFGEGQHNGRVSFGVVFRFGNR